jgi:hypothetical protein
VLARTGRACDDGRRAVRQEVEDREGAGDDRAGEAEGRKLRSAEMAHDRGVDEHIERLGGKRPERGQREMQDLPVVSRAESQLFFE